MSSTLNDLENHMAFNKAYYNNTKKDDTKINDTKTNDTNTKVIENQTTENDDFIKILKKYIEYVTLFDEHHKTCSINELKILKDKLKRYEEKLVKSYNLLKTKRTKYYVDNYVVEFYHKDKKLKLSNKMLGKIMFKYYSDNLKDSSKEEVNKQVLNIINFIEKERCSNEELVVKAFKKKNVYYSVEI